MTSFLNPLPQFAGGIICREILSPLRRVRMVRLLSQSFAQSLGKLIQSVVVHGDSCFAVSGATYPFSGTSASSISLTEIPRAFASDSAVSRRGRPFVFSLLRRCQAAVGFSPALRDNSCAFSPVCSMWNVRPVRNFSPTSMVKAVQLPRQTAQSCASRSMEGLLIMSLQGLFEHRRGEGQGLTVGARQKGLFADHSAQAVDVPLRFRSMERLSVFGHVGILPVSRAVVHAQFQGVCV